MLTTSEWQGLGLAWLGLVARFGPRFCTFQKNCISLNLGTVGRKPKGQVIIFASQEMEVPAQTKKNKRLS
jgi:hypothetical protein